MKTIFIAMGLFLTSAVSATNEPNWELQLENKSFQIYTAVKPDSEFLQVKAKVSLAHSWQDVAKQFAASGNCWKWQTRCKRVEVSDTGEHIYSAIDMPWPLSDREFLFKLKVVNDTEAGYTKITFEPDTETQRKPKFVRGNSRIQYLIQRQSKQQTTIEIYMHTEFGGDVSPGLINSKLVDSLEDDLEALIKLIGN